MFSTSEKQAQALAIAVPAALLAGAYVSQYGFGLFPCEMCWWQRYAHFAALALGMVSLVAAPRRVWIALAALGIAASGAIGAFHAGVEYGWWEGITACAAVSANGGNVLDAVLEAPVVRCDEAPFYFLGLSMAGWNAMISLGSAALVLILLQAKARR